MKFIKKLRVILEIEELMPLYYDNTEFVIQAKESRSHQRSKHILRHFHLVQEIVERQEVSLNE